MRRINRLCDAALSCRPAADTLGYEYLPEQEIGVDDFVKLTARIDDRDLHEAVDIARLGCLSGACPL